jgi:PhnB protein
MFGGCASAGGVKTRERRDDDLLRHPSTPGGALESRQSGSRFYVNDADATYQRALNAGARSLEEPFDTPYGDRRCMVEDKWGNTWQIATQMGERDAL